MSIERFFLINGAADFLVLASVARGFGAFRLGRIALAAALCAVYGTLAALFPPFGTPVVQAALLAPATLLTLGRSSPCDAAPCALSIAATGWMTGACAAQAGPLGYLGALAAPMACGLRIRASRRSLAALTARIEVTHRGETARFPAWIDTGNRLTEPLSGQPVLIASAPLVQTVLPEGGYRQVAYGSVGGSGTLSCFRPDRLYILSAGRRRPAPDTWIAVFPGRLPGSAQALAPAEFMLC